MEEEQKTVGADEQKLDTAKPDIAAIIAARRAAQHEAKSRAGKLGAKGRADSIARTKAEAERQIQLSEQFDQELAQEIAALREHTNTLEQHVAGTNFEIPWYEWLDYAEAVFRGSKWEKKYPPYPDEHVPDYSIPFKDRPYFDLYPDVAAKHLLLKFTRLSPELTQFLVRVLEEFLAWHTRHPGTKLDYIPEIEKALHRLKDGKSLYNDWVVERLQEEYQLQQKKLQEAAAEWERIKNIKHTPPPRIVPAPAVVDPLIAIQQQLKQDQEDRRRQLEEDNLRRMAPDALRYLRG